MEDSIKVLGIRVDRITLDQSVKKILDWLKGSAKKTVFTPNVEFIMAAQKDKQFYTILNNSNLNVPDSSRFSWVKTQIDEGSKIKKFLLWFSFPFSNFPGQKSFPVVAGVDLMENLCGESAKRGFTIGLLGGRNGVADKTAECLKKKYPGIKINYSGDGGAISNEGEMSDSEKLNTLYSIPNTDILFVAFGQVKQEKWIGENKGKIPAKVFMGVGGAFDYLSGQVPRAPQILRKIGLEWLFRLTIQPWRIKRFWALLEFVTHFNPLT